MINPFKDRQWNRRYPLLPSPLPPDPEKWDDIEAKGLWLDGITHPLAGNPTDVEAFFLLGMREFKARGATLADCLNAIRRKIGIPEREVRK